MNDKKKALEGQQESNHELLNSFRSKWFCRSTSDCGWIIETAFY